MTMPVETNMFFTFLAIGLLIAFFPTGKCIQCDPAKRFDPNCTEYVDCTCYVTGACVKRVNGLLRECVESDPKTVPPIQCDPAHLYDSNCTEYVDCTCYKTGVCVKRVNGWLRECAESDPKSAPSIPCDWKNKLAPKCTSLGCWCVEAEERGYCVKRVDGWLRECTAGMGFE